jgi:hypothetical protein
VRAFERIAAKRQQRGAVSVEDIRECLEQVRDARIDFGAGGFIDRRERRRPLTGDFMKAPNFRRAAVITRARVAFGPVIEE